MSNAFPYSKVPFFRFFAAKKHRPDLLRTVLYILMGVASYLIWTAHVSEARRERALTVYALQLAANFLWPVLFFTLGLYFVSFLWLIVLWVMILICTVLFHYISKTAGKLMLPYIIWTAFAGYLNLGIWLLNR